MKKGIAIVLLAASTVACERGIELPLQGIKGQKCCETVQTEEVIFRDPGTCSGMWFERPNGDMLEVFNYEIDYSLCCFGPCEPIVGQKMSLTYQCYDDSEDIRCEALCAFEVECERKGIDITKVEVVQH